jgi:hypothetical protein
MEILSLYGKKFTCYFAGGVVERLPSKHKALSSNPSTTKKKKKKEKRKRKRKEKEI